MPVKVRMATTTPASALQAALAGLGLVQATSYQVAPHVAEGRLVPVLADFDSEPVPVSLVHPGKRLIPLKLRAFLDFAGPRLERQLTLVDGLMGGHCAGAQVSTDRQTQAPWKPSGSAMGREPRSQT